MPPQSRVVDDAFNLENSHECSFVQGSGVQGSPNVLVYGKQPLRVEYLEIHSSCCDQKNWNAPQGSSTALFNNTPAARIKCSTTNCSSFGHMMKGSDIITGG